MSPERATIRVALGADIALHAHEFEEKFITLGASHVLWTCLLNHGKFYINLLIALFTESLRVHEILCVKVTFVVVVAEVLVLTHRHIVRWADLPSQKLFSIFAFVTLAKLLLHSLCERLNWYEDYQRSDLVSLRDCVVRSAKILCDHFFNQEAIRFYIIDAF